jgi:RHS repeat-associated protein
VIPRRAVPPALRGLLLVLAGLLLAPPAQASLPSLKDLARAGDELHARPSALSADLPRELPSELPKECNGPFCVEPLETRVRGFDLRLSCQVGGEGGVTCGSRPAYGFGYGGRAAERSVFTGHIYDDETGLYDAKARYFDPKLGRFLTQDSYLGQIDEPPSLHRYTYANDNPTTFVDPTGHASVQAGRIEDFAEQDLKTLAGYDPAQVRTQVLESPKDAHARAQARADTARRAKLEKGAAERLARLGQLDEAGFTHYANITIEESDFVNGRLDRAKVLAAVEQHVGNYAASEAPWLMDALLGRLQGAKAGATFDVSEIYSTAYAVSAVKAHGIALHEGAAGGYAYMGAMLGQSGAAPADLVTDAGFGIANAGANDVMLALGGYAAVRGLAGALTGLGREAAASVPKGAGIYPAPLEQRLAAFKAWRARGGDLENFPRFVGAHTPKARGVTLYHDPAQLRFGRWARSVDSMHGNAALSPRTAYLYRLEQLATGQRLKYGITDDPFGRYPVGFMRDKRMVIVDQGRRSQMLPAERGMVEVDPGPLNREPWAGKRLEDLEP